MAYIPNKSILDEEFDFNLSMKEYAIGGKLITAKCSRSDLFDEQASKDHIKSMLAEQIVMYMMQNGLIEYTKIPDMYNGGTTYIARCYIAPNEQVKILRTMDK